MLFDFQGYLSNLDPSHSYTIHQLIGGVVNVTVRAIKTSSSGRGGGCFPDRSTLILKYAPPYVAEIGESAPLSTFRQVCLSVDATILQLPNYPFRYVFEPVSADVDAFQLV